MNQNTNYYNHMNSQGNNHSVATGSGGKRYSSGDLELKPTSVKDTSRKICFQPIRTASLKNNHSAQNGPLLTGQISEALYPDVDLCEAPLLSRIGNEGSAKGNGNPTSVGGDNPHFCQAGVCLNESCPGIMFEDVDL